MCSFSFVQILDFEIHNITPFSKNGDPTFSAVFANFLYSKLFLLTLSTVKVRKAYT
jgi:hypothetical protein